ncbi:MAG: helicase C-terminal domain-containing protein, partial [Erysipelotrichaceae bacterium]|nr:helicase C-terminal domain-containing protein [Erysipelotrichaceae bacterium]
HSIVGFYVDKNIDSDEDANQERVLPFQVAYAVSIHKAQGLEYNSVKIVVSSEIEEQVTHNIFYTAITRAKEKLKVYWSPEVMKKVYSGFVEDKSKKDAHILAGKYNLKIHK